MGDRQLTADGHLDAVLQGRYDVPVKLTVGGMLSHLVAGARFGHDLLPARLSIMCLHARPLCPSRFIPTASSRTILCDVQR